MNKYILILIILVPSIVFSETRLRPNDWAIQVIGSDLENFYQLDDQVYRSEQPDKKSFLQLEKFGIKEILNLRHHHTDNRKARKTNLVLHQIKMEAGKITYPQIFQALQTINDAKDPILIHCWHGSDRTGVISASYRIVFQNWTKAQAIDEFKNGGYGYHHKVYPELVPLIQNLDVADFRRRLGIGNIAEINNTTKPSEAKSSSIK